jgi:alkanesulfonate monooxygenase SsuD/methylene tetrahydromethanopterin reductase-like flavin-dependent oxidoreductase (luciferase family)
MAEESKTTYGLAVLGATLDSTCSLAAHADREGLDAVWASEFYARSGTVAIAGMAHRTERCRVGSSIIYGVGRTPLVLASDIRDLDELSGGRLVAGLGNGTRRMMSDWHGQNPDSPALRMEELVPLVRRLLRLHEGPVRHDGRFYRMNLVPTGEVPPPLRTDVPIVTAGVRPRMIETAGRVADGLAGHPLFTVKYVEEVARPAIERGAAKTGRSLERFELNSMVICSLHEDIEQARREAAAQIAFYCCVKTYDVALDVSGFAPQAARIREAFARRDLPAMYAEVTDEMIDAMSVTGSTPEGIRDGLRRYEGVLDHILLYSPSIASTSARVEENLRALASAVGAGLLSSAPSPD